MKRIVQRHRQHNDYQIILLDWKLPDMDGLQIAREIRRSFGSEIPILLISAYDWTEFEEEAREAGISGFISKPLFKSTLFYGLRQYMGLEATHQPASCLLYTSRRLCEHANGKYRQRQGCRDMELRDCYAEFGGDYKEVLDRLQREQTVQKFVLKFLDDKSFSSLETALQNRNYEEALRFVHTLKGICRNLSFKMCIRDRFCPRPRRRTAGGPSGGAFPCLFLFRPRW